MGIIVLCFILKLPVAPLCFAGGPVNLTDSENDFWTDSWQTLMGGRGR